MKSTLLYLWLKSLFFLSEEPKQVLHKSECARKVRGAFENSTILTSLGGTAFGAVLPGDAGSSVSRRCFEVRPSRPRSATPILTPQMT